MTVVPPSLSDGAECADSTLRVCILLGVNAQNSEVFGTEVSDLEHAECFSTELAMVTSPSSVHPSIFFLNL